jgi:CheY-like chemotaxis protein/HPt (histidine-containing phosphotransfer) domain-containing protein
VEQWDRSIGSRLVLVVPPGDLETGGVAGWIQSGASAVVEKPISQSALLDAMVRSLGEQSAVGTATWIAPIQSARRTLRLLVAEDVPANQKVVRSILEQRGHRVDVVDNGTAAVERASRIRYDVVLMDLRMPNMGGLEATQRIRRLEDSQLAEVPIVALSAHVLEADRERCLRARMNAFVAKPIDADRLIQTVEHAAGGAAAAPAPPNRKPAPVAESAPNTSESSPSPIDLNRALVRVGGDRQLLREMAGFFQEDTPLLIQQLRESLDRSDIDSASRAAHSIKGLASNFDAEALQQTALRAEGLILSNRLVAARELLERLESELEVVCQALRTELP